MNRGRCVFLVALFLTMFLVIIMHPLHGQVETSVLPDVLAKDFVKAINDKDIDARKKILHPKTAVCINPQTEPFFDWIFSRQFKYVIPADYKTKTKPYPDGELLPTDAKSNYPVHPTHIMQIDYSTGPYRSTTIMLSIVKEGQRWYEVLPCPEPEAVSMAQSSEAKNREREARAKVLATELQEPLRTEIISLAREGHLIDAIKKYAAATGADLTLAKSVVELLALEK